MKHFENVKIVWKQRSEYSLTTFLWTMFVAAIYDLSGKEND